MPPADSCQLPARRRPDPRPLGLAGHRGCHRGRGPRSPRPGRRSWSPRRSTRLRAAEHLAVAATSSVAAVLGDDVGTRSASAAPRRAVNRWQVHLRRRPARTRQKFFARGATGSSWWPASSTAAQLNSVVGGITAVPWRTFLIYNTVGAALWVGWWYRRLPTCSAPTSSRSRKVHRTVLGRRRGRDRGRTACIWLTCGTSAAPDPAAATPATVEAPPA